MNGLRIIGREGNGIIGSVWDAARDLDREVESDPRPIKAELVKRPASPEKPLVDPVLADVGDGDAGDATELVELENVSTLVFTGISKNEGNEWDGKCLFEVVPLLSVWSLERAKCWEMPPRWWMREAQQVIVLG